MQIKSSGVLALAAVLVIAGVFVLRGVLVENHGAASIEGAPVDRSPPAEGSHGDAASLEEVPSIPRSALDTASELEPPANTGPRHAKLARRGLAIVGRFVDLSDRPLAGVELRAETGGVIATSLASGDVEFSLHIPDAKREDPFKLTASLEGYITYHLRLPLDGQGSEAPFDFETIRLTATGSISGRVVDMDGNGIAGARVVVTSMGTIGVSARRAGPLRSQYEVQSSQDGSFRMPAVGEGERRIWGALKDTWWSHVDNIVVEGGRETTDVVLRLEPLALEDVIELRVVDPDRNPVPGASVGYWYEEPGFAGSGTLKADDDGVCRQVLDRRIPFNYRAQDPAGRYRPAVAQDVTPGTIDLVLALGVGRPLEVRVRDPAGDAVAGFGVVSRPVVRGRWQGESLRLLNDGTYDTVFFQLPEEPFELTVRAEGYETATLGPLMPETMGATLDVVLLPLPAIRGHVFDPAGNPAEGAIVELYRAVPDSQRLTVNGFPCHYEGVQIATATATADEAGAFTLSLEGTGQYFLRAQSRWSARPVGELGPIEMSGKIGAEGLRIDIPRAGSLEGQVLVPIGSDTQGLIVGASRGDGHGMTALTDANGQYLFEGLTPGPWQVKRCPSEIADGSWTSARGVGTGPLEIQWNCTVRAGQRTRFDLDLRSAGQVALSGNWLLGGAPRPGWEVSLRPAGRAATPEATCELDQHGDFRLRVENPGRYKLGIRSPPDEESMAVAQEIELSIGENRWTVDLPMGTVEGRVGVHPSNDGRKLGLAWEGQEGLSVQMGRSVEDDGSFRWEVPAGLVALRFGSEKLPPVQIPEGGLIPIEFP